MIPSTRVVRFGIRVASVVPAPVLYALAAVGGSIAGLLPTRRRRIVLGNLERTAPHATSRERRRLARRTFRNFATAAVDLLRLPSLSRADLLSMVGSTHVEHFTDAFALQRGVIIVTGHIGPYELGGAWQAADGYPVNAMVEDLDAETLAALALYRTVTGMRIISMKQGIRSVFRLLAEKEIVLLVADRAIGDTRGVLELPFAGGVRPIPTGPATFAMVSGAPIIVAAITLNPARRPRYLIHWTPPLFAQGRGDEERLRLTQLVTERLTAAVRAYPDQWYVFQPQWITRDRD